MFHGFEKMIKLTEKKPILSYEVQGLSVVPPTRDSEDVLGTAQSIFALYLHNSIDNSL